MTAIFAPGDLVRARGREWVALPSPRDGILALRPLSGGENDTVILDPELEILPVEPARFDLPSDTAATVQVKAALLADAMRLTLRRGAGPFRSAAQLAFEPRTYQLVPLLMALRIPVPRLLIADDVGIGKTIEAGLILRELMDRGEVDAFSVLCPPHLVEQWVGELKARFGIEAVAVTSSTANRLERVLPLAQTLFDAYPFTVVSLDYIKAEKRREGFARACPDFVIVDEAHACVGTHKGRQQRFELLLGLARNPDRRMILLTATPHSGDEEAFARLLSLIEPSFASMNFEDVRYRERLARHYVQRRRIDLISGDWNEDRAFPKHETTELPYRLSKVHLQFQEAVLDYCLGIVSRAGSGQRDRRLAFWGTLALMRCVGSSPAAALSALRNRIANESDRLEPQIYDEDGEDEDAVDIEPGTAFAVDPALLSLVIHQFDHRWATWDGNNEESRDVTETEKCEPAFDSRPRYWVPSVEVCSRLQAKGLKRAWLMAWRDICRSHDLRTTIFSMMPRAGVGHTSPLVIMDVAPPFWCALLGNFDSLVLDYVARQSVGGAHLTYGYLKQFAVLPPDFYDNASLTFIIPRVLELTYTSYSMAPLARDLSYDGSPFVWDEDRRSHLRADLDAFYARAYGLNRDELRYILDPADVMGPDYPSETFRVLKEKEIRQFGEYRTRRLVLEAWDRMAEDGDFKGMGM
jgi:hypothetical protein